MMWPSDNLKASGREPADKFLTSYSLAYQPCRERLLWSAKPKAAVPSSNLTNRFWPKIDALFYTTTNSIYGSHAYLQPPPSLFSATSNPCGSHPSSIGGGSKHRVNVAVETGYAIGEERNGQLHCVSSGNGTNEFSAFVDPARCEDFLKSLHRDENLLSRPVAPGPADTTEDAECLADSSHLRDLVPANGQNDSVLLQPPLPLCSCRAWRTVHPRFCCCEMQTVGDDTPQGGTLPLACLPLTVYRIQPDREPLLTEYQASYNWPK